MMRMSYMRFALMIAVSMVIMFILMYFNTYAVSHIRYSQTRVWMALLMAASMAVVMLGLMWRMFDNRINKIAIVGTSLAVAAGSLWLVRSQATVDDVAYMKAMIPHHSIAIMTSERAHIRDPEVRRLADRILNAQIREIEEMKRLISRIEANPIPHDAPDLRSYRDLKTSPPPPETDQTAGIDTSKPIS